jgi:hypothetical protein
MRVRVADAEVDHEGEASIRGDLLDGFGPIDPDRLGRLADRGELDPADDVPILIDDPQGAVGTDLMPPAKLGGDDLPQVYAM